MPLPPSARCSASSAREERVVDVAAIRRGAARIGARLAEIEGARHLLLAEAEPMRAAAWAAIDDFLAEVLAEGD